LRICGERQEAGVVAETRGRDKRQGMEDSLFLRSVVTGDAETVRHILEHGPRSMVVSKSSNRNKSSALYLAAASGSPILLRLLLEKCDAYLDRETGMPKTANALYYSNDRDALGRSMLHGLLSSQDVSQPAENVMKCLLMLLDVGVRSDLRDDRGLTPLHILCRNPILGRCHLAGEMAEVLIGAGADPNAVDLEGVSPLLLSSVNRFWELCRVLLGYGADLNLAAPASAKTLSSGGSSPPRSPKRHSSQIPPPPPPLMASLSTSPIPKMCRQLQQRQNYEKENEATPPPPPPPPPTSPPVTPPVSRSLRKSTLQLSPRSPKPILSPTRSGGALTPSKSARPRADSLAALMDAYNASAFTITAADMIPRSMRKTFFAMMDAEAQTAVPEQNQDSCMECARPLALLASEAGSGETRPAKTVLGLGRLSLGLGLGLGRGSSLAHKSPSSSTGRPALARKRCAYCKRVVCEQCCRFAYPTTLVVKAKAQTPLKATNKTPTKRSPSGLDQENKGKIKENGAEVDGTARVCESCIRAILSLNG